jgi:transposase-like protein
MFCCPACHSQAIKKRGFFKVKGPTTHQKVQRLQCKDCGAGFSTQTGQPTCWQKKAHVNQKLFRLLCQGVSQRSGAFILGVSRDTVAKRIAVFGALARQHLEASFQSQPAGNKVVFDELETFEHTKCKPISVAIAVDKVTRRIISVEVASMPAKGPLAAISRAKYGKLSARMQKCGFLSRAAFAIKSADSHAVPNI